MRQRRYDFVVIGGGFYGCCLALFLRSIADNIIVIEAEALPVDRASRVNQARVHTGYHYPRSFVTAHRSMALHQKFLNDFSAAIVDDFQMLYAIATRRSKVSASRFARMFKNLGASVEPASVEERSLFSGDLIEDVFRVKEFGFDYRVLREILLERMHGAGIEFLPNSEVIRIIPRDESVGVELQDGYAEARGCFNVTYSSTNAILQRSGLDLIDLKHEFVELALVRPPELIAARGVTVMDGPFFSMMPYPSEGLHSLTHVRYTPHLSWEDTNCDGVHTAPPKSFSPTSKWRHMMMDAQRYLPCMRDLEWVKSVFEIKTILKKNERDDGRPILFHRDSRDRNIISILGGKIDNIYDLFDIIGQESDFRGVNFSFLLKR